MSAMDMLSFSGFGVAAAIAFILTRFNGRSRRWDVFTYLTAAVLLGAASVLNLCAWQRWFMPPVDFVPGTAVGVVESSRILEHQPVRRSRQSHLRPYEYDVVVHYTFKADGRKWVGHCSVPGARNLETKEMAEAKVAQLFQPGAVITVYFDPADPYENSLDAMEAPPGQLDLSWIHGVLLIISGLSTFAMGCAIRKDLRGGDPLPE